jgi:serine/threonine-protein kinase
VSINLPAGQTLATEYGPPPFTVSPDGRKLAYAVRVRGVRQLYIRDLDRFESRPIAGTEGAYSPFFSPDGQSVGFFTANALKKVALPDGAPIAIAADVTTNSGGASWGPDDTIAYRPRLGLLMRVPAGGGTPEPITRDKPDADVYRRPHILPDGENVLFTIRSGGQHAIAVVSLETGQVRRLDSLGEASGGQYVPTGHLVYGSSGSLLAAPFDPDRMEVQGDPILILDEVRTIRGNPHFTVSEAGTLVYIAGGELSRSLVWVDREGRATRPVEHGPDFHVPRLSPDGGRVAFESDNNVWIHDLVRGTHTRLVINGNYGIWTPDGARLAIRRSQDLYSVPADGSGEPELFFSGEHHLRPISWSPDGRFLTITEIPLQSGNDIWVIPRDGEPIPFLVTSFQEGAATFSPDGRFLAYISDESGKNEVYVQPFPGPGQKTTISTEGGAEPVWSPGGGELFYRRGSDMMVVEVTTGTTFSAGKPRLLFSGNYWVDESGHPSYDVSPDGQRFLMVQDAGGETLTEIRIVLNWTEELKRLVPTGN